LPKNPADGFESDESTEERGHFAGYKTIDVELFDMLDGIEPKHRDLLNEKVVKIRNQFQDLVIANANH